MDAVALEKSYPENYSNDVLKVLETLQLGDGFQVVGSASLRSQKYAGDFDCIEDVHLKSESKSSALNAAVRLFQTMIGKIAASPTMWLSDIKAGIIDELRIVSDNATIDGDHVVGYDATEAKRRLDNLIAKKIVDPKMGASLRPLLVSKPSVAEFAQITQKAKFHIVRWTASEVKANKKTLLNGKSYTLQQAFLSPSIIKVDVLAPTGDNRISEFSCIYRFLWRGEPLNNFQLNYKKDLAKDISLFTYTNQYFKALKRAFSLAKVNDDYDQMERLSLILNSDLGLLYQIIGDMRTLSDFLREFQSGRLAVIDTEIEQFTRRLSNIYSVPAYLKLEPKVLHTLHAILQMPNAKKADALDTVADELDSVLQSRTRKLLNL